MGDQSKHTMYRDGQMRAALDHEAQARIAHQRNSAWKALHTPAGFQRMERYQTSDPTLSLATVQDGRPVYDFAAAPSLFVEEDLRQERHMLQSAVRLRFAQWSSALPSRLPAPMQSTQPVLPLRGLMSSATCSTVHRRSRSAHQQNVLPLLPLQRQLQRLHAMLRQWLWRLGVHRIVPLLSVVAVRLRATASR